MWQHLKRGTLILLLVGTFLPVRGQAQSSSGDPPIAGSDKATQLRQQIEELKKNLATLEEQLSAEEQRKREQEAAAEASRRQEQLAAEEMMSQPAQGPAQAESSVDPPHHSVERTFGLNILSDQKAFWTSPLRLHLNDAPVLFPFLAVTAATIASDNAIEQHLPHSPTLIQHSQSLSNYGVASMLTAAGGLYLWGKKAEDDHAQETGFLAGEAALDSLVEGEAIKLVAGRERPLQGNGRGEFWQGGSSFPAEHAAAAWSVASILAHEYPGPLTELLAYGAASGITAARVIGREHFASDALVGSALGWYSGWQVYRSHHNPELNGAEWGTFERSQEPTLARDMGSPYVPLDSWVYPVFDRLVAMGYVQTGFAGLKPWTRMECARLVAEAGGLLEDDAPTDAEAVRFYHQLQNEFSREVGLLEGGRSVGAEVESVYTRSTAISGPPLTDGYHFGQTLYNDFGRPYAQGFNQITGLSTSAEAGPLAFYFRGEYQHAPALPEVPLNVQQAIAAADVNPVAPSTQPLATNRFQPLDSYAALNLKGFQVSAGQESLWYGPGQSGPLIWSDNAEPIPMVRISQNSPLELPGVLSRLLGPVRTEFFFGKLERDQSPSRAFVHGETIAIKFNRNLEFGYTRTVVFGISPQPLTWGTFFSSFVKINSGSSSPLYKPGKQTNSLEWTYRIPGLRKWLLLTGNAMEKEYPIAFAAPARAAINPGVYMPQLPKIPKLDLRIEAVYTNVPSAHNAGNGQFDYFDYVYHNFYTNNGNLLGSWIGRDGIGLQAWSTYWLSPRSTLQLNFRRATVSKNFLEGGEYTDYGARADLLLRPRLSLASALQYEQWDFPLLSPTRNSNFTASLQLTYWPKWRTR
ncbi:MAG: capsule assembly Wzi family protein [Terriglobales bacterium]